MSCTAGSSPARSWSPASASSQPCSALRSRIPIVLVGLALVRRHARAGARPDPGGQPGARRPLHLPAAHRPQRSPATWLALSPWWVATASGTQRHWRSRGLRSALVALAATHLTPTARRTGAIRSRSTPAPIEVAPHQPELRSSAWATALLRRGDIAGATRPHRTRGGAQRRSGAGRISPWPTCAHATGPPRPRHPALPARPAASRREDARGHANLGLALVAAREATTRLARCSSVRSRIARGSARSARSSSARSWPLPTWRWPTHWHLAATSSTRPSSTTRSRTGARPFSRERAGGNLGIALARCRSFRAGPARCWRDALAFDMRQPGAAGGASARTYAGLRPARATPCATTATP